jgi:starvation-inducible DNA-binding protein
MKYTKFFFITLTFASLNLFAEKEVESTEPSEERKENMKPVNIGLDKKVRDKVVHHLQKLLASEYTLYTKTLKFHWNVQGPFFGPLHALFKEQYEQLLTFADDLAERSLALGTYALGTMAEFNKLSLIKEHPGVIPNDQEMLAELAADHEALIRHYRSDVDKILALNDQGTANFLLEIMEKHEKIAWMLRAHLR